MKSYMPSGKIFWPLNNRGVTLVELLLAAGILSFVILGIAFALFTQRLEAKALSEKFAALSLNRMLLAEFRTKDLCSKVLALPPGPFSFPTADFPPKDPIALGALFADNSTKPLVSVDQQLITNTKGLAIDSIELKDITVNPGVPAGDYKGKLQIKFKDGVKSLVPITYETGIRTTELAGVTTVTGCSPSPSANCALLGGTLVAGECTNYIGQVATSLFKRTAGVAYETERGGPSTAINTIQNVSADPQSAWYHYCQPTTPPICVDGTLDGAVCNAAEGWRLLSCFGGRRGLYDVDIIAYSEIIDGKATITGCVTNDGNGSALAIQCVKNY